MKKTQVSALLKIAQMIIIGLVCAAIFYGSWSARHGEIVFNADIARDFLLFNELTQDPIMLIGPRADYKGLFHGPAWLYVNFPAYLVGEGNPAAVSIYWVLMTILFGGVQYIVASKLFDKESGLVFASIFIVSTLHYVNQFYNPTGAMFISPLFVYFAYMYVKTQKVPYMLGQLFLAGMMLQFQLAAGIPIIILSTLALIYLIIKNKNYSQFLGFLILGIPLSTFLLFELKFGFPQFNAVLNHFNGTETYYSLSFADKLGDRFSRIFGPGIGFFAGKYGHYNRYIAAILIGIFARVFIQLKNQPHKDIYFWGLYYFLGFYVLSFIHNGSVLLHYYLPFMFIPVLLFSSMHKIIDKRLFYVIVIVILGINVFHLADRQNEFQEKQGTYFTSWASFKEVMAIVEDEVTDDSIGVFVYAPDAYAYAPKYTALYMQRTFENTDVSINQKKSETFLIYEQPPENQPWLNGSYWKTDLLSISAEPVETVTTVSGYTIERYELDEEDIASPIDPLALDWVTQR